MQPGMATAMVSGGVAASPLLYGAALEWYLDGELGLAETGGLVDSLTEQVGSSTLTVPGGGSTAPAYASGAMNGFDAITFNTLDDRLESSAAIYDDLWAGPGLKRIVFGFDVDLIANDQQNATLVLCDKGLTTPLTVGGWQIRGAAGGTGALEFVAKFSGSSRFLARANGILSNGFRALGWIDWDGTRSGATFAMRLWDGIDFVGVGVNIAEQPPADAVLLSDAVHNFALGNNAVGTFNGNLEGKIGTLYATKPQQTSQDALFLRRYLP